jgi:hypothetical protein
MTIISQNPRFLKIVSIKRKVKISLLQAVEVPRVAGGQGSHISYTNG